MLWAQTGRTRKSDREGRGRVPGERADVCLVERGSRHSGNGSEVRKQVAHEELIGKSKEEAGVWGHTEGFGHFPKSL